MAQDLQAQVADLSARLARLEAERAVIDTLNRYGHSIDYGDDASWLDCFTDDGVFDVQMPGGRHSASAHGEGEIHEKGIRYAGKKALTSFIETHTSAPAAWHKHMMVEPRVTLAPDLKSATNRCYFERIDDRAGKPTIVAFGRYLDELVYCPDAVWRFKRRTAEVESLG